MLRYFLLSAAVAVASNVQAASPAPTQEAARIACDQNTSRVLPGDYNFCLGHKYWESGKYESARQMLELAAGWGNKAAQRALGVAYFNGDGLTEDRPLGLAWLALAAERKEPAAAMLYNSALARTSVDEQRTAVRMLVQLRERYADDVAALRADNRFQRTLREMSSNPVYGRGKCLPGSGGLPPGAAFAQAVDGAGNCSMAADNRFMAALERRYEVYSEGWSKRRVELGKVESLRSN
ncbi:hypothetical protein ACSBPQ_01590 [Stenotrophomonas sp. JC08]|uniref:hypothetical protein n=1 Tax=Stenotrophomonas sp. JC08 TaxID=3445779 RepID=UPI003FA1E653